MKGKMMKKKKKSGKIQRAVSQKRRKKFVYKPKMIKIESRKKKNLHSFMIKNFFFVDV